MLKSLHILNYALISELDIDFESGFSVITGETGAGKSIILGALSLILGQRADIKSIKEGEQKCVIEAEFNIKGYQLQSFFDENELDYNECSCLVRRELTSAGKSRAFINDTPVSLNQLRELTSRLIDIHSQHENLLLSNEGCQMEVVDTIARNQDKLSAYKADYQQWKRLQSELIQLKKTVEKQQSDEEYIRFQFQQLADAKLLEGEQEELEQELDTLSHAEEIKIELQKATQSLSEEQMALPLIKESLAAVSRIKDFIANGNDWVERIHTAYVELKDIADEMSAAEERIDYNPERLQWVENRLSELYGLLKKYKVESITGLISLRNDFDLQLQRIESFDDEINALEQRIEQSHKLLQKSANELTKSRQSVQKSIEDYLVSQLALLGMPNVQFQVNIGKLPEYTEGGQDDVQFLFSANKNRNVQPILQIASGGEISRVMLSIKSLIANKAGLPTIIFDEIDTGVSGEIAHRMGEIMKDMSRDMQVITITHLPQIAAKGVQHYKVYKDETSNQVQTHIQRLDPDGRTKEIAQMLSGKQITDAALLQARQLLNN